MGAVLCEQAAADLGLYDTSALESQKDDRPHGCIYGRTVWLLWNSPETQYPSAACGSEPGFNCICLKGKYSNNNRFEMVIDNRRFYFIRSSYNIDK